MFHVEQEGCARPSQESSHGSRFAELNPQRQRSAVLVRPAVLPTGCPSEGLGESQLWSIPSTGMRRPQSALPPKSQVGTPTSDLRSSASQSGTTPGDSARALRTRAAPVPRGTSPGPQAGCTPRVFADPHWRKRTHPARLRLARLRCAWLDPMPRRQADAGGAEAPLGMREPNMGEPCDGTTQRRPRDRLPGRRRSNSISFGMAASRKPKEPPIPCLRTRCGPWMQCREPADASNRGSVSLRLSTGWGMIVGPVGPSGRIRCKESSERTSATRQAPRRFRAASASRRSAC